LKLEFFKKLGIVPNELRTRWEWVDEKKSLTFYRDFIYPQFNRVPKISEIYTLGFRGFLHALKRFCRSYNDSSPPNNPQ